MAKLLLYCVKAKPYLYGMFSGVFCESKYGYHLTNDNNVCESHHRVFNGKVVAECDYEVEEIFEDNFEDARDGYVEHFYTLKSYDDFDEGQKVLLKESCLQKHELSNYLGFENGYAIHIKNLHIFDEPKELSYYCFTEKSYNDTNKIFTDEIMIDGKWYRPVNKAPQNMMRVKRVLQEDGILISIRPEWLCKILNGEKTIEVRKKVLKEMVK